MIENAPLKDRKNIFELTYAEDEKGNDILCYPDGSPYTGVVFEALPSGSLTAEYEVKDGLKNGVETAYYSERHPESITHYRQGHLHGDVTYFYPEGAKKEKSVFEYGICIEEFSWDEAGNLTHHHALGKNDSSYPLLERLRAKYKWNRD